MAALLQSELNAIRGDHEALIWAIGCAWTLRVETYIAKARPLLTCSLMLLGMYLSLHYLVAHLSWYGLSPSRTAYAAQTPREFIKLAAFLIVMALVCLVAPGEPRRKVIAAVVFPLFAMMTLEASSAGFEVVRALTSALRLPELEILIRVALFGSIVAALVSLPFALLYRDQAASVACLALTPVLARTLGQLPPTAHTMHGILEQVAPFACSLLLISAFSRTCRQWLRYTPSRSLPTRP